MDEFFDYAEKHPGVSLMVIGGLLVVVYLSYSNKPPPPTSDAADTMQPPDNANPNAQPGAYVTPDMMSSALLQAHDQVMRDVESRYAQGQAPTNPVLNQNTPLAADDLFIQQYPPTFWGGTQGQIPTARGYD